MGILIVLLVIILLPIMMFFLVYNGLVAKKNQVNNAFAGMDALLKKRYDLIPNLVSTVKTYMKHEANLLTEVTELRAKATSGKLDSDDAVEIDNKMSKIIGGIMVAVENYPDLKANQNFIQLQKTMNEIEEQISAARRAYNAAVTDFNNAIEMFPSNIVASMMNIKVKKLFEITEAERQNVDVGRLFDN